MKQTKRQRKFTPPQKVPVSAPVQSDQRLLVAISIALAVSAVLLYARTFHYGFIAYDDNQYVKENVMVKAGLSLSGIIWALTTMSAANWHPLTWMSYMLDVRLFGVNTGWMHAVNVMLHAAAAVLLFLALERMTHRPWRCAVVAGIFALHPAHVESVAWIAERKDVLSTMLEMVAFLLYARYVESRTVRRYLAVLVMFALSLMAKPMLVTFPLVLLLLDFWPLGRAGWPPRWPQWRPLIVEKAPLLALSAISSVLTYIAQHSYGAVIALQRLPLTTRLANAALAYVAYIGEALWPVNLGVLYPVTPPDTLAALLAVVFLVAVTAGALRFAASRPYLATGWFWFTGMLVPVIGLIQVGVQARADRYTYVPMVGLSIAVVWAASDWAERRQMQRAAVAAGSIVLLVFGALAYGQVGYWQSSRALFEHTLAITQRNYIMYNNLGVVLAMDGDFQDAEQQYRRALALSPDYPEAHANLGHALLKSGRFDGAAEQLRIALLLDPKLADAQADTGILLAAQGDYPQAVRYMNEALRLSPGNAVNESNLCFALLHGGQPDQALTHCREALRLNPDLTDAHFNLGILFAARGQSAEARAEFDRVLSINPGNADARRSLEELKGK